MGTTLSKMLLSCLILGLASSALANMSVCSPEPSVCAPTEVRCDSGYTGACWNGDYCMPEGSVCPLVCWFGPTEGRVTLYGAHGGGNQQWKVTTYKHQGGAIAPCVGEAVVSGSSFQMINLKRKKVLHVNADGSVTMSKKSDQKWKWATNSCNPELLYLSSVPSGLILASDGKTVTDTLEENAWTYDEVEMTMESEIGGFLSDTKKHGIAVRGLRNTKEGKPWKWFQWNLV